MSLKITSKAQFELLIDHMVANPYLARGIRLFGETKASVDEVWNRISSNLNSYGPPTRTPGEWQRVWIHFKAKLKKKMAANSRSRNITGGGPSQEVSLSPLERTAADLIQINIVVDPEGDLCCGVEAVEEVNEPEASGTQDVEKIEKGKRYSPTKRVRTEDQKVSLLKDQTATQSELVYLIKNIEKGIDKHNEIMGEIKEIKRKKYEAFAEEQEINLRIKKAKLAILQRHLNNM